MLRTLHVAPSLAAVLACVGCLAPSNPFDPNAPPEVQAKASVSGVVSDGSGPVLATVTLGDAVVDARDDGTFAFTDVTPGAMTLEVEHPSHQPFARDLLLVPGDVRTVDVVLVKLGEDSGSRLSGIARKAAAADDADPDHSGISVEIEGVGHTQTSKSGAWELVVADGTYTLTISAPEHLTATLTNVEVAGDTAAETTTLAVNPGSVEGIVTLAPLVAGAETHGGVTVSIGNRSAVTLDDDAYRITGLGAGPAIAVYARDDYATLAVPIVVQSGALLPLDPVHLVRATGVLNGVVDVHGLTDDTATVTLSGGGGTFSTSSAPTGEYTFTGIPTGTYDLSATRAGFRPASGGVVDITAEQTAAAPSTLQLIAIIGDFVVASGAAFTNERTVDIEIDSDTAVQMRLSESSAFNDAAFEVFAPASQFDITSAGDGDKTIFLELMDAAGAVSGPFSASVVLDTTAPDNASVTGPAFSNDGGGIIALALFATDEGSGVSEMQLDTDGTFTAPFQPFTTALALPLVPNVDGAHTITVRFRDRAGNETEALGAPSLTTVLDRTPPEIDDVVIHDATTDRSDFATSSFVIVEIARAPGSEDAALMAVSSDPLFPVEVYEPFADLRAFTLLPGQGERTVAVKLRDLAGNESNAFAATIDVDSVGPRGAFVTIADGADVTADATPALTLFATDFIEVRVSTDGVFDDADEQYSATIPTTTALAAEGSNTLFAQFRDGAGNESDVVSDSITLDTTPPVLDAEPATLGDTVVIDADGSTGGAEFSSSVSVLVSFDVDGADEVAVATDGNVNTESFQPFASVATVVLPAGDCPANDDACKSVCAVFRDRAGNTTAQVCDEIGLDTTPPAAPLLVEGDSVVAVAAQTLHLVDKVEDAFFDHYEIFLSPSAPAFAPITVGPAASGRKPFTVALTAPAAGSAPEDAAESNLIRIVGVDRAGNRSPESAVTIVVDDVAPAAPTLAGMPAVLNADTVSVNFLLDNPADDDATFDHYLIGTTLLPAPVVSFQRDGIVVTLLPDQVNTITVQAVDAAGNVSAASLTGTDVGVVREDSTAPSAPSIAPFGGAVRAEGVELYVVTPAVDAFDPDGNGPQGRTITALTTYDLKDGRGLGFQRQAPGNGPFIASLKRNRPNELCVRGVDAAGNQSDADCITVDEETARVVVGAQDGPHGSDIFGDFLAFVSDDHEVVVRDLTGTVDDVQLGGCCAGSPFEDIHVVGDNSILRVAYDTFDFGTPAVALHMLDIDRISGGAIFSPEQFTGFSSSIGTSAAFATGFEVVYAVTSATANKVDLRRRPAALPLQADAGIVSAISLCAGTTPSVNSGVVVWCETQGTTNVVRRQRTAGGAIDTISRSGRSVPLEQVAFFGDGAARVMQPFVTERMIVWAEDVAGVPTLVVLADPLQATPAPSVALVDGAPLAVDALADASGTRVALRQRTVGNVSTDVFVVDVLAGELTQLTADLPPQDDIGIDGARVSFQDTSTGETVVVADLTGQRWLSGSTELSFDAQSSTGGSTWLETKNNAIRLLARTASPGSPIVEVDEPPALAVVFNGPAKEDPAWAIGGTVVAWLSAGASPGTFRLTVKEIVSGAKATVATDVAGAIAMDPDGDQVVYVDTANRVQRATISFTPPSTLTVSAPILVDTAATNVTFTDVDDGVVVWQQGGTFNDSQSPGTLRCKSTAGGAVAQTIDLGGTSGTTLGRGPKLGRRGAQLLLAYLESGTSARVCPFACGASSSSCTPRLQAGTGPGAGVSHSEINIARDGIAVYLSTELNGSNDIVVFDPFSGRRTFLTADTGDQDGVCISEGQITYGDTVLGNFDVWEASY